MRAARHASPQSTKEEVALSIDNFTILQFYAPTASYSKLNARLGKPSIWLSSSSQGLLVFRKLTYLFTIGTGTLLWRTRNNHFSVVQLDWQPCIIFNYLLSVVICQLKFLRSSAVSLFRKRNRSKVIFCVWLFWIAHHSTLLYQAGYSFRFDSGSDSIQFNSTRNSLVASLHVYIRRIARRT